MKKKLLLPTMFLLSAALTMNGDNGAAFFDVSPATRLISAGIHVSDGITTIRQNYTSQIGSVGSFTLTPGNSFAVGVSAVMNINSFIGIGTGLDFSINNYYYSLTLLNENGISGTLTSMYSSNRYTSIDIPVYAQFSFNIGSSVRWVNRLGIFYSRGLGGYTDNSTYRSATNELGQSFVYHSTHNTDYFNAEDGLINRIINYDYGLHVATGLSIADHYYIGVQVNTGMKNVAKNFGVFDTKVRTLGALVKIGYVF